VQSSGFPYSSSGILIHFPLSLRCFVLSGLSSEARGSVSETTLLYEARRLALRSTLLVFLDLEPAGNEHLTRRRSWGKALRILNMDTTWRWVVCFTLQFLLFGSELTGTNWI